MLEVLAAGVLVAVTLGTVFNVILSGKQMIMDATRRAQAMRVAQNITERERTRAYSSLTSQPLAAVPGVPGMQWEVKVTLESHAAGGVAFKVKRVETRVHSIYRSKPTVLSVAMLRAP